jgi:heme exporter protein C
VVISPRVLLGVVWMLAAMLVAAGSMALSASAPVLVLPAGLFAFGAFEVWRGMNEKTPAMPAGKWPVGPSALATMAAVLAVVVLWQIFAVAPVEAQMGIVQKIFYFHVPSAYSMYVGFTIAMIGSIGYVATRRERWDALGVAGAEVGLLFCAIVLITGPLWARKAWGVYWTWDPRLTTTLLAGLVFTAFVVLRSFGGAGEAEKRFAAGLAIVGFLLLPVIHWSVQRWRGQHPTVITRGGGGLHPDMVPALVLSFVFFTVIVALLVWVRARAERAKQDLAAIETEAAALGLLEDS